jgi:CubicO group peptidase (beta-lactamase class C family)
MTSDDLAQDHAAFDLDPKSAGFDVGRLARIDEHLQRRYLDAGKIAGCQVIVARGGHVAHRSTLGHMDAESGEPLADDAIWRWYSMSKPVTGVALLSLIERGLVRLADPIARFLPEWADIKVKKRLPDGSRELVEPERPITVRDAMMHMTGIGFGPREARLDFAALATGGEVRSLPPGTDLARLSILLAGEPLRFHPGSHWFYSWSTDICGCLVEAISGRKFGDYLRETIFEPLGMADAGFSARPDAAARVTSLYTRGADKKLRLLDDRAKGRLLREPTLQSGGGGMVGTLDDYARFCQMLLSGGALDGARVLSRPTVELMRTNHLPGNGQLKDVLFPGSYGELGFDGNGFGLTVAVGLGPAATGGVGPAGSFMWGGAASTIFWIDPAEDLFAVFMTQLIPSGTFDFRGQLRSLVYGAIAD